LSYSIFSKWGTCQNWSTLSQQEQQQTQQQEWQHWFREQQQQQLALVTKLQAASADRNML
jgi:hypothetical protein